MLSFITFPDLLSCGRAGLVALQLRTGLRLVRNQTRHSSVRDTALLNHQDPSTSVPQSILSSPTYLDPELFVSLSQRVSRTLDTSAAGWSRGDTRQQQEPALLRQALRQYLSGSGVQPEHHTHRQLLASYVAFNGLSPAAGDGRQLVQSAGLLENPLKAVHLLKSSPHPASLFRMLNTRQPSDRIVAHVT
jgi:hypothetical protein